MMSLPENTAFAKAAIWSVVHCSGENAGVGQVGLKEREGGGREGERERDREK